MEARIENYHTWIKYSSDNQLKNEIEGLIAKSGFTVLNFIEHHFEPQGYTALWLLAESHCALHTFPEEKKAYIELSSCNIPMYTNFIVAFNQFYHS